MGDYEAKVTLDANVKKMQLDDVQKYQAMYTALAQNPLIKQDELTKLVMERVFELDKDEAERLIAPPPMDPMMDPSMQGDMMSENPPVAGQPPMDMGMMGANEGFPV